VNKVFRISFCLSLLVTSVCLAGDSEPEEVYLQYLNAVPSSESARSLDSFLSSRNLSKRNGGVEKLKSKGKIEAEINARIHKQIKRGVSCKDNIEQIDKIKSVGGVTVIYSFKDICSEKMIKKNPGKYKNMTVFNVLEVHLINEDGWKIDSTLVKSK